jgi:hypothetical protein
MYQVSPREIGQCILCPDEQEVVTLTKGSQTVSLCRRHVWEALKANGQARPKKAKGKKTKDQSQQQAAEPALQ